MEYTFTPLIRLLLSGFAAAVSAAVVIADALPEWARIALVVASAFLAGIGIVPPTLPPTVPVKNLDSHKPHPLD